LKKNSGQGGPRKQYKVNKNKGTSKKKRKWLKKRKNTGNHVQIHSDLKFQQRENIKKKKPLTKGGKRGPAEKK